MAKRSPNTLDLLFRDLDPHARCRTAFEQQFLIPILRLNRELDKGKSADASLVKAKIRALGEVADDCAKQRCFRG